MLKSRFSSTKLACESIRFSSIFAVGDRFRADARTSPAAKSEEKQMFSQAFTKLKWFFIRVPVECYIQITAVTTYYKNVIYF